MFRNVQMTGGLVAFFFQFMVQSGIFFTIPLFLSVVLELSALQTGLRLLPLSVTLLLAALLVPRLAPKASPRTVVRVGMLFMLAGTLVLVAGLDPGANAGIVLIPMALVGLGIGALASQLGAVTVSAMPDSQSAEVGGLQNTFTNFGASLGTALVGAVLIGSLTTSFITGVTNNPAVPAQVTAKATVQMESGIPFVSDSRTAHRAGDHRSVPGHPGRHRRRERLGPADRAAQRAVAGRPAHRGGPLLHRHAAHDGPWPPCSEGASPRDGPEGPVAT